MTVDDNDEDSFVGSASLGDFHHAEVILEGPMLKRSRGKQWQERYIVFYSNQTVVYMHKKDDDRPKAAFRVTRESGCEISDVYVEQRTNPHNYHEKESLYCVSVSWPDNDDDTKTAASYNRFQPDESIRDDFSFGGIPPEYLPQHPQSPARTKTPVRKPLNHLLRTPLKSSLKKTLRRRSRTQSPARPSENESTGGTPKLRRRVFGSRGRSSGSDDDVRSTPKSKRRSRSWGIAPRTPGSVRSNIEDDMYSLDWEGQETPKAKRRGTKKSHRKGRPSSTRIPSFVDLGYLPEDTGDAQNGVDAVDDGKETAMAMDVPPATKNKTTSEPPEKEQKKLLCRYIETKRKREKEARKKFVEGTKMAVAAGTAVGVGVMTAGVGLVAGLVFLGAAAAAGGTAGAAEAGIKRKWLKHGKLTIASKHLEEAKLWKSSLDACLEMASFKASTWGQMFVEDGRRTTSALLPKDHELVNDRSREFDSSLESIPLASSSKEFERNNVAKLFLKDRNFFAKASTRWRPIGGGWLNLLGPGSENLRVFKEERSNPSKQASTTGSSAPLKAQMVLNAQPLDVFLCMMSCAKLPKRSNSFNLTPNSGQIASFRQLEKIDDHMDIVHMVCRELYLFPSWTAPRDFVLFRYWRHEPDGSYVVCYESVEHKDCPHFPGFVRGEMHQVCTIAPPKGAGTSSRRRISGGGSDRTQSLLTTVVQVNPRGWVPTKSLPFLWDQSYVDGFGMAALQQTLDIRDAIEADRFVNVTFDLQQQPSTMKSSSARKKTAAESNGENVMLNYDLRFANRERCDSLLNESICKMETYPAPLNEARWAEPDANSFLVRGPTYKQDRIKINAGSSIGRLFAVDLISVDAPLISGISLHPTERIQLALEREKKLLASGKPSDMPPFIFLVNILLPGTSENYHSVHYFAIEDISTIDGSNGTSSSKLCQKFLFGDSDQFRDETFKLIPQIVDGNFIVRKAVGSTPAIMGTKLKQTYVRTDRYMEVILDCASSQVATGVIRLSLGYAKTLMVDMGFLLEGDDSMHLPERIFGCTRLKYLDFATDLRHVKEPSQADATNKEKVH